MLHMTASNEPFASAEELRPFGFDSPVRGLAESERLAVKAAEAWTARARYWHGRLNVTRRAWAAERVCVRRGKYYLGMAHAFNLARRGQVVKE